MSNQEGTKNERKPGYYWASFAGLWEIITVLPNDRMSIGGSPLFLIPDEIDPSPITRRSEATETQDQIWNDMFHRFLNEATFVPKKHFTITRKEQLSDDK